MTVLEQAGASVDSLVKLNVYLTDIGALRDYGRVRGEFLPGLAPAGPAVQVAALAFPGMTIELEAVAALQGALVLSPPNASRRREAARVGGRRGGGRRPPRVDGTVPRGYSLTAYPASPCSSTANARSPLVLACLARRRPRTPASTMSWTYSTSAR